MAPQSARRSRKTSAIHSASEHAWVMWIRFANSHTGQRHHARANRPDRWQHPTTAKTRIYSCIFWGVHRWIAEGPLSRSSIAKADVALKCPKWRLTTQFLRKPSFRKTSTVAPVQPVCC